MPILRQAQADGKRVAVPKVYGETDMRFLWLDDPARIAPGAYGIPEPVDDGPEADDPAALVLMPGLAFDPQGHRLGYGGGFYDPQGTGTGRLPYGFILHNGKYLLGENVGPNEKVDFIGFTDKGQLIAGKYSKKKLAELGAKEGLTFGPPLIINGEKVIKHGDGGWGISPRSAIGQRKDGTVLFLVVDGRQPGYSIGATLADMQNIMYKQGAYIAANLDGGSSTTLYYNGKVVNKPADLLGERMIPTSFIVK